jgi:hypothetical protein
MRLRSLLLCVLFFSAATSWAAPQATPSPMPTAPNDNSVMETDIDAQPPTPAIKTEGGGPRREVDTSGTTGTL